MKTLHLSFLALWTELFSLHLQVTHAFSAEFTKKCFAGPVVRSVSTNIRLFSTTKFGSESDASSSSGTLNRRSIIDNATVAFFGLSALSFSPPTAQAEVSEGTSLPDGAAQFARVVGTKNDLIAVSKRVREKGSEIDKKEWESISVFLRKVYNAGDDMKFISKTMTDQKKKDRTLEIVKSLQKLAVAGDLPAQNNDAAGYLVVSSKLESLVGEFFDLLQDVPDEI